MKQIKISKIQPDHLSGDKADRIETFETISAALASLADVAPEEEIELLLTPGIYHEKVSVKRPHVKITGLGICPKDTVITYDDYAFAPMPDGSKRGTFRSYTLLIHCDDVQLENLTVANESGDENLVGQAIALYAEGDGLTFTNCRFIGRQDTIFTGPLPPKELQPGGFIGPTQFAPRRNGRQLYKNCYICGNVDFIFGSATAYFDSCTIESVLHPGSECGGYVTAPSTPEGQTYGYVFFACRFISSDYQAPVCYLGRPWRDYGQSVFIDCIIGEHIMPEGFHDWKKENARKNAFFAVCDCKYPDGSDFVPTAPFAKNLPSDQKEHFNQSKVLEHFHTDC